jgi:hypothetical protein
MITTRMRSCSIGVLCGTVLKVPFSKIRLGPLTGNPEVNWREQSIAWRRLIQATGSKAIPRGAGRSTPARGGRPKGHVIEETPYLTQSFLLRTRLCRFRPISLPSICTFSEPMLGLCADWGPQYQWVLPTSLRLREPTKNSQSPRTRSSRKSGLILLRVFFKSCAAVVSFGQARELRCVRPWLTRRHYIAGGTCLH